MKKFLYVLIFAVCFSEKASACSVDDISIDEMISEASHIFIGYVVEIKYVDFEEYVVNYYNNNDYQKDEDPFVYIGAMYKYRTVPLKTFKSTGVIPQGLWGGYCRGAHVSGAKKYIIMTYQFADSDEYGSKAWSADSPYFKELEERLYEEFSQ
ncbi:MAG: hypothetical protein OQJ80_04880 [Kangiella sp.]|nr:hypothetical protein [Kangiella sp.]